MKKVKLNTARLRLVKERIGKLSDEDLNMLNGGSGFAACYTTYDCTTTFNVTGCCNATGTQGCTVSTSACPTGKVGCPSYMTGPGC